MLIQPTIATQHQFDADSANFRACRKRYFDVRTESDVARENKPLAACLDGDETYLFRSMRLPNKMFSLKVPDWIQGSWEAYARVPGANTSRSLATCPIKRPNHVVARCNAYSGDDTVTRKQEEASIYSRVAVPDTEIVAPEDTGILQPINAHLFSSVFRG